MSALPPKADIVRHAQTLDGERRLDDALERSLRLDMDALGCKATPQLFLDVCKNEGAKNSFHPVKDYFAGLIWDGVSRLDRWLHIYAGAENTELNREVGRKTLVAAVRRIRHPGTKFDTATTLESEQGKNKSSLIRALMPEPEWFTDGLQIGADSKVVIELTAGKLIVEFAELAGMRGREIETVKAMLSRQVDISRLAYGRLTVERPRQFIFIGSVNPSTWLNDPTGNRRFWPVVCGDPDLEAMVRDRDQLWAEAVHVEAGGESLVLSTHLWPAAKLLQDARGIEDPYIDKVQLALALPSDIGAADIYLRGYIAIEDLWQLLEHGKGRHDTHASRRIKDAMRKLGYEKSKRRREGVPTGCYVPADETEHETWLKFKDLGGDGKGRFYER